MKTRRAVRFFGRALVALAILLGASEGLAQSTNNCSLPVVTVVATDATAAESGDPGAYTVYRDGNTNSTLNVFYLIGGSASNGVDCDRLANWVVMPAGATSAQIPVTPINDNLAEGNETVVIQLAYPPCLIPVNYLIGSPSSAAVTILDDDTTGTNQPSEVNLVFPTDGAVFVAPVGITIFAFARDAEGSVSTVEFFEGANSLGIATNNPYVLSPIGPFHLTWYNVPPGNYTLTAKATDNGGAMTVSPPVNITVKTNPPPPTNFPPVVTIFATDPVASEGANCFCWPGWSSGLPTNFPCPNTATFVVRRFGDTNSDLTVFYSIGGTASNGVDYAALPGEVAIPAGRRSARITVLPVDDNLVEPRETVILKLLPPTNSPPYIVGFPGKTAAVIVDNDQPGPTALCLPDRLFHCVLPGTNGAGYRLEVSTDLISWTALCTNVVTDGAIHFVDPDAPAIGTRFYRAVPEPYVPVDE